MFIFQVTPFTEDLTSPKKSSFSSYVLSFLPSATANPNSPSSGQTLQPHPESLPVRWNSGEWEYKQVVLSDGENDDKNENKFGSKFKETVDYDEKLRCCNGYQEENLKSLYSDEYQRRLSDKSEFISLNLFDFLESSLPSTIKGSHWVLLYRYIVLFHIFLSFQELCLSALRETTKILFLLVLNFLLLDCLTLLVKSATCN